MLSLECPGSVSDRLARGEVQDLDGTPFPPARAPLQFKRVEPSIPRGDRPVSRRRRSPRKLFGPLALCGALACVLAGGQVARADDDDIPTFKKDKDRETKEFVAKVGSAIVHAARSKPQKIEVEKYEYTKPKAGRTELKLKMIYYGVVTKKKYTADIVVILDSSDATKWEVLNITYKDTNPSPAKPSVKSIQELIPKFNK